MEFFLFFYNIMKFLSCFWNILFLFIIGGKFDKFLVFVDGFDVWDIIFIGKLFLRIEIFLNIDLVLEEEFYNEMEFDDLLY